MVVNGIESDSIPVVSGVPQGSVLGPLLFLIYIDGLARLPLSTHSKISFYADDVLIYKLIEYANDIVEFQCDINKISEWTSANHMIFNTNKCKCMMLSKKRHPPTPSLYLNSQQLELVKCYKYSGVCIESDLSWNTHITEICKKAKKIIGLIYQKISLHTDPQVMAKLYIQQIRPHLQYGAPIWHQYLSSHTSALERVQKFALRMCLGEWTYNYEDLLEFFNLPTLENRRHFLSICLFFKLISGLTVYPSDHLPTTYTPLRPCHDQQLYVQPARTNYFKYSFIPRVSKMWNHLPADCVECENYLTFKRYTSPLFMGVAHGGSGGAMAPPLFGQQRWACRCQWYAIIWRSRPSRRVSSAGASDRTRARSVGARAVTTPQYC